MSSRDRQYLTLVTWPGDLARQVLADKLEAAAGLDAKTIYLQLGRTPPCILGSYDSQWSLAALSCITSLGGDAFCCGLSDIEALGATHKIKHLEFKHGALIAEIWRNGTVTIDPTTIHILIRAKLSEKHAKPPPIQSPLNTPARHMYGVHAGRAGFALGGAYGAALAMYAQHDAGSFNWEKTIRTSDKLDIHLADSTIYQIDGDKFGFQILGDQRGLSDNENIDKMCELFTHLAPNGIVDPYFSMFKSPPHVTQLRIPNMKINKDDPTFAFYSRWAALMYRHVLGA